jgi:hypothetical protein
MSDTRIYKTFLYLAGIQVPFISASVSSQYGSLSNLNLELNYSPYITHIHEYSKIQLWEQIIDNGTPYEPTLEFDGIVVGIVRNKNVLGNVSVRLTCLTDGFIWNQRKQYDFYIDQLTQADVRLTDTIQNIRADGAIDNFISNILTNNKFDVGCAVASILTADVKSEIGEKKGKSEIPEMTQVAFTYTYNGKKFYKEITPEKTKGAGKYFNPKYYKRFLDTYKLGAKLYGVSTSTNVKDFFQQDRFMKLLEGNTSDLLGENTFWSIALNIMQYGFYSIYDIPNPTYISGTALTLSEIEDKDCINLGDFVKDQDKVPYPDETSAIKGKNKTARKFSGLAEYILKPISVFGLPLKCNVIWPNQVISESLFYDLANTPTRILMQKTPLPGDDGHDILLTTAKLAGPRIENCKDFFESFTPPIVNSSEESTDKIRRGEIYSDYEKEYGMRYTQLHLSYAFESTLLEDELKDTKDDNAGAKRAAKKINNFLNYEFAQRFFASRNYSIQVTPDVDVVPGLPVVVLHENQEHVICFCTGKTKSWDNRGNKSVGLNVGYPRYYYEDIDKLGNIIDPTTQDEISLNELKTLFGSEPLVTTDNGSAILNINSKLLKETIDNLYKNYNAGKIEMDKYKRKVCTFKEFMSLHGQQINSMVDSYLVDEDHFGSSANANALSSHVFFVKGIKEPIQSNKSIIDKHLAWISEAQKI